MSNAPSKPVSFSRPKVGYFSNRPRICVCVCVCVCVCIDGIIHYKFVTKQRDGLCQIHLPLCSALHGNEGSGHKLQDYDTVQSTIRGQNFEGVYLYNKVRRNIIIPSSNLNVWHCVRSVHRYPSTRICCVIKQKPTTLSIALCQMGVRTPPAYLQTWQNDSTQLC